MSVAEVIIWDLKRIYSFDWTEVSFLLLWQSQRHSMNLKAFFV